MLRLVSDFPDLRKDHAEWSEQLKGYVRKYAHWFREDYKTAQASVETATSDDWIQCYAILVEGNYFEKMKTTDADRNKKTLVWMVAIKESRIPSDLLVKAAHMWIRSTEKKYPSPGQLFALIERELEKRCVVLSKIRGGIAYLNAPNIAPQPRVSGESMKKLLSQVTNNQHTKDERQARFVAANKARMADESKRHTRTAGQIKSDEIYADKRAEEAKERASRVKSQTDELMKGARA